MRSFIQPRKIFTPDLLVFLEKPGDSPFGRLGLVIARLHHGSPSQNPCSPRSLVDMVVSTKAILRERAAQASAFGGVYPEHSWHVTVPGCVARRGAGPRA